MDIIYKLFDLHKIPTKVAFLFAVVSGLLLFNPYNLVFTMQLNGFVEDYGKFLGVTFLLTFGLVIVNSAIAVFKLMSDSFHKRKFRKQLIKNIMNHISILDRGEKAVLREFFIQESNTIILPIDNPTIEGLIREGIIEVISSSAEFDLVGYLSSCQISGEARAILTSKTIDLPLKPTDEDVRRVQNERPAFINRIKYRNWLRI